MPHVGCRAARGIAQCSCRSRPGKSWPQLRSGARLAQCLAAHVLRQVEPHASSRHVPGLPARRVAAQRRFDKIWLGLRSGDPGAAFIVSRLVAITGATGFFGRYIVSAFATRGWRVRILARQPIDHPQLAGLQLDVVSGDLSNKQALRALVDGADAIVHAAGLIKASSAAAFEAVNVYGTANLARAIEERGVAARVLLVSSMAAREPGLSSYARTKRAGEELLMTVLNPRCDWTIVRPCAIYGPWDRETLTI